MKTEKMHQKTEELLTLVRAGEQAAFCHLAKEYEPLVLAEVSRYATGLSHEDTQDLSQIALVALYRAALGFDLSQREVEFGLYAKICISNALVSQLRVLRRRMVELPLSEALEGALLDDPAVRVMEEEALQLLHRRIRAVLSPYELRVWTLYTAGYRSGEIANQLKKDTHSVENAVYRIRQKLRRALGDCR